MRIRSIKPEFYRSDDIDALDWDSRLIFIALWSYVDDNGVGRDKLANIAADIFAGDLYADPTETLRRLSLGLTRLEKQGLIERYKVDGKAYLHVSKWEKHQLVKNPNKPRYPLPTCGNSEPPDSLPTLYGDPTAGLPPVTGEQGNRGTDFSSPNAAASADPTPIRDDVDRICRHLAYRIVQNGSKEPTVGKTWHDAARLMLDKDGRTEQFTHQLIDWCQGDQFWRANVLSMPTLREKFDQLRLQMAKENNVRHIARNLDPDAPPMIPLASDDKR